MDHPIDVVLSLVQKEVLSIWKIYKVKHKIEMYIYSVSYFRRREQDTQPSNSSSGKYRLIMPQIH